MRKIVVYGGCDTSSSKRPIIYCKQCTKHDVHLPDLQNLLKTLLEDEEYSWADFEHEEYQVYKVRCEGESGIGVSAAENEYVCTDLRHKDADGFWLDDANVKFLSRTYRETLKDAKKKAKELGLPKSGSKTKRAPKNIH
jgi:hypothetical protein